MRVMALTNILKIHRAKEASLKAYCLPGLVFSLGALLLLSATGYGSDEGTLLEEYRSVMDRAAFADKENGGLLDGWKVFTGDTWPEAGQEAPADAWTLNSDGAFCPGASGPLSLVSPPIPLEEGLESLSASVMATGAGSSRVILAWMAAGNTLEQVTFRESPPAPDGRRRFNLSESIRPAGADTLRLALMHTPEAGNGFCWQTARVSALFKYVPEIELLYNRVGYEQVAPKRFTVWSNFPAQTGHLTLADLTGEVVFQAPLGDGERILGADGAMWEGYYYRGDFTNFEEEGAYTLAITLDASEPLAAEIQIGFNLLWEKAFLPAVQAFQRHRADNSSGDGVPRLWNDPGLNGAPDALLLWSLVYSWSLLRMRFAGEPPLTLLEQEAFYGADRVARWILQGNAEKLARHEECERYLNALSCIANYKQSGDEMLEAARQVLSLLMAEKRDGPWVFFAALDLYAATGEETWLVYAQEIYPGLTLERVESLLEYEAITSTLITIPLQHTFTEMMDQVIPRANNPFGLACFAEKDGRGFFAWKKDVNLPLLGNAARVLSAMQTSLHAFRYTARKDYQAVAYDQLNWLLGNNPYGSCLVTGLCGEDPPVAVAGETVSTVPAGLVLHGIGPRAADLDLPHFAASQEDGPTENTNGYSLRNNALYIQALSSLKRIPAVRPRQ